MIDKVQKIREEVERLKSQLLRGACSSQITMGISCKEEAYDEVLTILDSLQKEPISEDLEEAATLYAKEEYRRNNPATLPDRCIGCYEPIMYAFRNGANWREEQMMANTVDAMIGLPYENKDGGYTHLIDVSRPLTVGNNKIAIIFKED